jgi:hypothetical protein
VIKGTLCSSRSRFLSRLQAFVDVVTEHDRLHPGQPPILPSLRKMAEDMLIKVMERWPADTKPLGFYPAFQQDALQLGVNPAVVYRGAVKAVQAASAVEVSESAQHTKTLRTNDF